MSSRLFNEPHAYNELPDSVMDHGFWARVPGSGTEYHLSDLKKYNGCKHCGLRDSLGFFPRVTKPGELDIRGIQRREVHEFVLKCNHCTQEFRYRFKARMEPLVRLERELMRMI